MYRIVVGTFKELDQLENLGVDVRIMCLKVIVWSVEWIHIGRVQTSASYFLFSLPIGPGRALLSSPLQQT
jgi:hypothetical protein